MRNISIAAYANDLAIENMAVGLYCRKISKDGSREYVHFNRFMKEVFVNDDVPSSKYWQQKSDDEHDTIVLSTLKPYREEYPMPDENGNTIKWLVFIKRIAYDSIFEDGCYIVTTVIDVTERKKYELMLAESRLNLKIATDTGKMSTWDLDVKQRIFTITNGLDVKNPTISLEEHVLLRHYNNEETETHTELLEVMAGKQETGHGLYMIKDKDTGEILYRKSYFMGVKVKGIVTHVIGSTQDITESYRQKETIQKRMEELNLAMEAGKISAWIYDVKAEIFHTLYGNAIAREGVLFSNIHTIIHPDDITILSSKINSIVTRKEHYAHSVCRFLENGVGSGYRFYDSCMMGRFEDGEVTAVIGTQRDITEEFLHREQLEEFNLKTRLINEATNSILWDYNIENHTITYTLGSNMSKEPITFDRYIQSVNPKDRNLILEYFEKANKRELDDFSFEIDLMLPGSDIYSKVAVNGVAVRDDNENILKYSGIRRDLSELVKLNSELKEQDTIKNIVVNNMLAGLILFTKDCQIVWSNEAMKNSFAYVMNKKNVLSGQICEACVYGKCTIKDGKCMVRKALESNSIQIEERQFGDDTHIEVTSIPVNDDSGIPLGVLIKLRDISESKRMINELRKSKEIAVAASEFVSTLMDRMPGAIFIIDPEHEFRIVKVNDKFCEMLKRDKSEVIGKTNIEIFGKVEAGKYDPYDLILTHGTNGSISYEASLEIEGKNVYWMINKSLIRLDGKRLILAVSTDISDLKAMNAELTVAKEKAQEADKLKSAFLANMSHEIRTPLNAIVGFSRLITETDDIHEQEEYSKIINNNTQMLLRLIGDILDLSKIEAGATEFKRNMVEISSFFNELTESLALKVTNPEVKFITSNPYKTCYVNLDKLRFGQVITNFVTNAIKYTQKGYIKVSYYVEKQGIMIRVDDTGIGIPANKRERVFTRFDKLDSLAQGTGLGLSIAKVLTEAGGGKIWFESEEGKGSSFFSWKPFNDIRILQSDDIPIDNVAPRYQERENRRATTRRISRILVAEDNESNFMLIQKILKNYTVDCAKDGIEAVEKVAKSSYDLVLMDIKMPIMDGLDATRQIRKFNSAIPIVAITANAYAIDHDEALLAGCNEFISKPILKEELLNILNKY